MYEKSKALALRILKAPTEPPEAPAGSGDSVKIYRASPQFLRYRLWVFWFGVIASWLAVVATSIALAVTGLTIFIVIDVILIPTLLVTQYLGYFAIRMDYDMRYYIVTDRSLRVREGAVIVKEMTLSHANVQNLRVVQGPILRFFGIWNLKVDSAGGGSGENSTGEGSHQIQMAGIDNAHEVRDLILSHLRKRGGGAGLGDLDDQHNRASGTSSAAFVNALRGVRDSASELRRACEVP